MKGVIRSCKSKKVRQHNGQKKKDKRTYNGLQNNTQKTKDRATRTLLKTGSEFRCSVVFYISEKKVQKMYPRTAKITTYTHTLEKHLLYIWFL
jgi:hypothetical protein